MKLKVFYLLIIYQWIITINEIFCFTLNTNKTYIRNYGIQSTLLKNTTQNLNRTKRNIEDWIELILMIDNKLTKLCLIKDNDLSGSIAENASVFIQKGNENEIFQLTDLNISHIRGYISNKPFTSSVTGYIEKERFFGKINIEHKCYYVERINKFPSLLLKYHLNESTEEAIIYQGNIEYSEKDFQSTQFSVFEKAIFPHNHYNGNKVRYKSIRNKLCTLMILIDNSFLSIITKNNIRESISIILHNIQEANAIFRSTDFDGDGIPDNIGFVVKYILIADSKGSYNIQLPKYTIDSYNGNIYLRYFSHHPLLNRVCLGIAFTAQTFKHNVIGLSYTPAIESGNIRFTGGICEICNIFGECQNALVITYRSDVNGLLPQIITELSLAHELGHSFGADHDQNGCYGYLMSAKTFTKLSYKNFMFSQCSKKKMANILRYRSFCMMDSSTPFCGNGILENGEECDCGIALYCAKSDACCQPRGTRNACSLNKQTGYECHPSQGLCCTSQCKYRDISYLNLSCKNFNKEKSPCSLETATSCGIHGSCLGKSCHSTECTRIGLEECMCPPVYSSNSFCHTCCLNEKKQCIPAYNLTERVMKTNNGILNKLQKHYQKYNGSSKLELYQNICIKDTCVIISYRIFPLKNFCLYNGKLGFCSEYYQCILNDKQIYPKILTEVHKRNKGKRTTCTLYLFIIYIYVFVL